MLSRKWKVCFSYTGDSKSKTLKITCNSFFPHKQEVLFQKRVQGLHQVSKREKAFEAEWFYCFRAFGNRLETEILKLLL